MTDDSRAARIAGNVFRSQGMNREHFDVPASLRGWWLAALDSLDAKIRIQPDKPRLYARRAAIQNRLENWAAVQTDFAAGREAFDADTSAYWITGNGDHVVAPHIPFDEFESFTIELWTKKWSGTMFYQGYGYEGLRAGHEGTVALKRDPSRVSATVDVSQPDFRLDRMQQANTRQLPENDWVHLALVYRQGRLSLFMGGKRVAGPREISEPGPYRPDRPFWIGYHPQPRHWGDGLIRSVHVSRTALYDAEFEPVEKFAPGNDSILLFDFMNFDFLAETKVPDLSGNGNHGQIKNAWWIRTE